jgi:hypothetical protein
MCGPFLLASTWWIFPLGGILTCLGFLIILACVASTGRGWMCMGGYHAARKNQVAETSNHH